MAASNLIEEMKKHTMLMELTNNHSNLKMGSYLKMTRWTGEMICGSERTLLQMHPQWGILGSYLKWSYGYEQLWPLHFFLQSLRITAITSLLVMNMIANCYFWDIIKKWPKQQPKIIKNSLKTVVMDIMAIMNENNLIKACESLNKCCYYKSFYVHFFG